MVDLLRMDLRRMVRGKTLLILCAVLLGVNLASYLLAALLADPETLAALAARGAEITAEDYDQSVRLAAMSMLDFLRENLFNSGFWLVTAAFGAGLFTVADFTSGYGKTIFALLPRRGTYAAARAISLLLLESAALAVTFAAAALAQPLTIFGTLGGTPLDWLVLYAEGVAVGGAISLLMLFWAALTRSEGWVVAAAVVFGSGLLAALVSALCGALGWFNPTIYTICGASQLFAAGRQPGQLALVAAISGAWGLMYLALTTVALKRRDIA